MHFTICTEFKIILKYQCNVRLPIGGFAIVFQRHASSTFD